MVRLSNEMTMLRPWSQVMVSVANLCRHGLLRTGEEQLKPNLECASMYPVLDGPVPGITPEASD